MDPVFLLIDYETYHSLTRKLAASLFSEKTKFQEIIAISRGGLTLGHLLSDLMRIPISTIAIQSYTDIQKQGELKLTSKLQSPIKDKNIILVDDVADSGKTLQRAKKYLRHLAPKSITTVTLFYKHKSVVRPDYFAKVTNKWIIFPYESAETVYSISQQLYNKGKTKADIQTYLEKLGFSDAQIAFVRRHHLPEEH